MVSHQVAMLRRRAELKNEVRAFFAAREILEVDTRVLSDGVIVEAHIDPVPCRVRFGSGHPVDRYLLTSPEGPMKLLVAAGSGPIYQLAPAFRDGEVGNRHAVEFTLLEWYRPGFSHFALMNEVEDFVQAMLPQVAGVVFDRLTYREVFLEHCEVDPFATSLSALRAACERLEVPVPDGFDDGSIDDALDLLLVGYIEPRLGRDRPLFVHAYPPSQAALAQVASSVDGEPATAHRFELYVDGVELANGYHELADAAEQRRRFERANRDREAMGKSALPIDEPLLEALQGGFPPCSGVALGFDRLLMLATGQERIQDV